MVLWYYEALRLSDIIRDFDCFAGDARVVAIRHYGVWTDEGVFPPAASL